ncbi:MAG: acyl carrier protein [Thermaurantimonas sp.]
MNITDLERIIKSVLQNRGKELPNLITNETRMREDLGMDSLDLAELTVKIEAEYDIDIFADGLVNTAGEILKKFE